MLVVGASRGGHEIAEYAEREGDKNLGRVPIMWSGEALDAVGLISVRIPQEEDKNLVPNDQSNLQLQWI
jgi:hypothetical protein